MDSVTWSFNKNDLIKWIISTLEMFVGAALAQLIDFLQTGQPVNRYIILSVGLGSAMNFVKRLLKDNTYNNVLPPSGSMDG